MKLRRGSDPFRVRIRAFFNTWPGSEKKTNQDPQRLFNSFYEYPTKYSDPDPQELIAIWANGRQFFANDSATTTWPLSLYGYFQWISFSALSLSHPFPEGKSPRFLLYYHLNIVFLSYRVLLPFLIMCNFHK